ncbi:hypothetical protein C1Y63_10400 [Corynebacterium sp. 13CS0277]|uniref:hypothetical protein n=1 Tax=Corynebacterium sp. 13CS0277 TaxID=2071994 RepID=UPI000D036A92|nr:hypothetical protein [Corynebacterium sp. 13CS0277]PRQ10598.1 hypothetical protein C1Y63_10400 [Corynebacterium sp. 13CS0277]
MTHNHEAWIDGLPGVHTRAQAAQQGGVAPSTVSRQLRTDAGLDMKVVRDISRGAGLNPVDQLVNTGHLEADEAASARASVELRKISTRALMDELWTRTDEGSLELTDAVGVDNVVRLNPQVDADFSPTDSIFTDIGSRGESYAADTSPDEPQEGEDDYHDGP